LPLRPRPCAASGAATRLTNAMMIATLRILGLR
jgi:hypothetical protein